MRIGTLSRGIALAFGVSVYTAGGEAAELSWQGSPDGSAHVFIEGTIDKGDEEKFRSLAVRLIRAGHAILAITVYSPGGSVSTALHIGRQIRTLKSKTNGPMRLPALGRDAVSCTRKTHDESGNMLPSNQQLHWTRNSQHPTSLMRNDARCVCTSACFLIWAGGIQRGGDWIGVHRPYFDRAEYARLSPQEAEAAYRTMLGAVRSYLAEMEIPDTIIRKMLSANSENMHYLTTDEAKSLENDRPALEELAIARCGGWKKLEQVGKERFRPGRYCDNQCEKEMRELHKQYETKYECMTRVSVEAFKASAAEYLRKYGQ